MNKKLIINTLDLTSAPEALKILQSVGNVVNLKPDRKTILSHLEKAVAYMSSAAIQVDEEFLKKAPSLKIIGSPSTGTDHLDLKLIKQKNIIMYDISKEYSLIRKFTATSELAFGLMLSLVRNIYSAQQDVFKGIWSREKHYGFQLFGKTLGIIGMGRLGNISARIANGFGMKVIAFDPFVKKNKIAHMVDFIDLLKKSDIVTLHLHLTKKTEGLIGLTELKSMKRSSIIVNTSRGKIIDEGALLYALQNKEIAGAGLDVVDGEWLNETELKNHALIKYSKSHANLLIVPHIGGSTVESINLARIFMAKKIKTFLEKY